MTLFCESQVNILPVIQVHVSCCAQLEDDFCSRSECKVIIFLNIILASRIIMQLSYFDKLYMNFFHVGIYGKCLFPWEENGNNLTCIATRQLK